MKKALVFVLALIMVLAALPVVGASADEVEKEAERAYYPAEVAEREYPAEMIEKVKVKFTTRDVTDAEIAWVKQATGVLIWAPADDARSNDEIIAQAKEADASLTNGTKSYAVMKGLVSGLTPNANGDQADVSVDEKDGRLIMAITGDFSHFGFIAKENQTEEPVEAEKATLRIDAPLKMAVAFEDGTVYYGGEMKEVIVGKEYAFQMCSVNWENGVYDENGNGITGTVVYRMIAVHQDEFNAIADKVKSEPERFTVKGIDVIDNKDKMIFVNIDAEDTHLETDVNNFFMAYRFHFDGEDYNKKTGIAQVVNTPVESLSVNLPLGSTITCKAYEGDEEIDKADVLVVNNSGTGVYDDVELTSVNDFTWGEKLVAEEMEYAEAVAEEYIDYAK
ncbi:MAG: hypothetical protein IJI50_00010 [Ruminococcus sp.]|nr:hypothetical protein [Ruminococcus sp.]